MTTSGFALLVPVKEAGSAKTRLDLGDPARRGQLMRAFVQDVLSAGRRSRATAIYVVGDAVGLDGCIGLPDEGRGDLNEALRAAARRIARPDLGIAVLLADLPCLRTEDLDLALTTRTRSFVADAAGTGTTMLLAPAGEPLDPQFGADSARRHLASGARPLTAALATLRRDVDTTGDLEIAVALGVGRHTRAALHPS